jgi:hypothetical protein
VAFLLQKSKSDKEETEGSEGSGDEEAKKVKELLHFPTYYICHIEGAHRTREPTKMHFRPLTE